MKTALLVISDLEYFVPTQVLLESLKRNSPEFMSKVDLKLYSDSALSKDCIVRDFDIKEFDNTAYEPQVFKMMSMLILAMEELKDEYDRIVYLDCDCLVNSEIVSLLTYDLKGNGLGACREWHYPGRLQELVYGSPRVFGKAHYSRDIMVSPDEYINSGVLLIDCHKIKDGIWDRYLKNVPKYMFPDQDFLYEEYLGDTYFLPQTYNAKGEGYLRDVLTDEQIDMYKAALENSKIIHYVGGVKPWHPWVHSIKSMTRQIPYVLWIDMLRNVENVYEQWVYDRVVGEVFESIPKPLRVRSKAFDGDVDDLHLKFLNEIM